MEAYVQGASARRGADLVEAMDVEAGISKSEVSRNYAGLEETVGAFRVAAVFRTIFSQLGDDAVNRASDQVRPELYRWL